MELSPSTPELTSEPVRSMDTPPPLFLGGICNSLVKRTGKTCTVWTSDGGCCGYHRPKPVFNTFDCPICLEECTTKKDQFVTTCGHRFHKKCAHKYGQTCGYQAWPCPMCRTSQKASVVRRLFPQLTEEDIMARLLHNDTRLNDVIDEPVVQSRLEVLFQHITDDTVGELLESSSPLLQHLTVLYLIW